MHRLTRRLGARAARRPWTTIGLWLAAMAAVLALAAGTGGEFTDSFAAPGSESAEAMRLLEEHFPDAAGGTAVAVFVAAEGGTLADHRDAVVTAVAQVAAADHVTGVVDPFTAGTVSVDGRIGYAQVLFDLPADRLGREPVEAVEDALAPVRDDGAVAELGGDTPFLTAESEASGAEGIGVVVAGVVLVAAFGSVVAGLVPVGMALVAVAIGVGGLTLLARATDVSTVAPTIGVMIGLGVGIDYALFVVARYRELRSAGRSNAAALAGATSTAGSAVLLAGGTVVVAMGALVLTGVSFLTSMGLSTAFVVLVTVAAATTLLPAVLTLLGDRIDKGRLRRRRPERPVDAGTWWRFAHLVARRPWPWLAAATLVLAALALPALSMQTGFPDAGGDSTQTSHRRAYDLLAEGFGPGVNSPLLLVADLREAGVGAAGLADLAADVAADEGIDAVGPAQLSPDGDTAVLQAIATTAAGDAATAETLERVRAGLPANVAVGGMTAMTTDLTAQLSGTLPLFIGAVLVASFLLLMLVFRSVVVPLKAALVNLLSIGAAYGVVVAVFQWGWLGELVGLEETMAVISPLPPILFAILFGLSMDYEVFLLSRIREEYVATGDSTEAVARGLAGTGRVITSAALIMTAVFLGFMANPSPMVRMMGLGLVTAVVLDATLVRMVVVPAAMTLMGRANWWLPAWLDRRLPHLHVEASEGLGDGERDGVAGREPSLAGATV